MENSAISWCHHTFNPWMGCTKVSPACDGCYAEALMDTRFGRVEWGPGKPRVRTGRSNWNKVGKWNRDAHAFREKHGCWPRVFCASLSDWLDPEVPDEWFRDLLHLIEITPNLRWMLLTKRIGRALKVLPDDWAERFPHVGIMATVENQEVADRDIPKLLQVKAEFGVTWVGVSMEPLLGPVSLESWLEWPDDSIEINGRTWGCAGCDYGCRDCPQDKAFYHTTEGPRDEHGCPEWVGADRITLDMVVTGGETDQGDHKARVTHPDWFRSLRDQCAAAGTAFHHKQNGEWISILDRDRDDPDWRADYKGMADRPDLRVVNLEGGFGFHGDRVNIMQKVGKVRAGHLLDGIEHRHFPEALL